MELTAPALVALYTASASIHVLIHLYQCKDDVCGGRGGGQAERTASQHHSCGFTINNESKGGVFLTGHQYHMMTYECPRAPHNESAQR